MSCRLVSSGRACLDSFSLPEASLSPSFKLVSCCGDSLSPAEASLSLADELVLQACLQHPSLSPAVGPRPLLSPSRPSPPLPFPRSPPLSLPPSLSDPARPHPAGGIHRSGRLPAAGADGLTVGSQLGLLLECDPGPDDRRPDRPVTPRRLRQAGADGDPATTECAGLDPIGPLQAGTKKPSRPIRMPRSGVE